MERNRRWPAVGVLVGLLVLAGCGPAPDPMTRMTVQVVSTRPHDVTAFTEGLEIRGDVLYEGTGLSGASRVSASKFSADPAPNGEPRRPFATVELPAPLFGEGITVAENTLWQLTWQNHIAIARDPVTLAERNRVRFDGEGWGLCARGDRLVMSNGSDTLTFRDPSTFAPVGTTKLTSNNGAHLNELDCAADGSVYANDWTTDRILRIDPDSGAVTAVIDAAGLLTPTERNGTDVLNGIAQIPGTDRFLITGKNWPKMFEVRFVPA